MAMIAANLQDFSKANSRTTQSRVGIDSANTWRGIYTLHKGWEIRVTRPDTTAIVLQSFVVEVKLVGEEYLVTSYISNAYEFGATPGLAIKNYLEILVDGLIWLEQHESELSPSVHEELHLLQKYIRIV